MGIKLLCETCGQEGCHCEPVKYTGSNQPDKGLTKFGTEGYIEANDALLLPKGLSITFHQNIEHSDDVKGFFFLPSELAQHNESIAKEAARKAWEDARICSRLGDGPPWHDISKEKYGLDSGWCWKFTGDFESYWAESREERKGND